MMSRLAVVQAGPRLFSMLTALLFAVSVAADAGARGVPGSFADLAERLSPAVVNISTVQQLERPDVGELPDGPFNELFRDFFDRQRPNGGPVQSLGSGFVISADGFVVTNDHVIKDADEVKVNFVDGTSLDATVVGTDDKTDLALLKVVADGPLPFVEFGDSNGARVGDWVLAIGNRFGLGGSVSAGIISARNRDIRAGPYDDFLQTDAAINRGNSGGPLFNLDGQVIGVNTAIISPTGGSIGIGFAVPASLARNVVSQLRDFGETRRGWLGVRIQEVTDEIAESLGLDTTAGALVNGVTSDGPAESSGIQPGDVILRFDGREVAEMRDLPRMVAETPVGKTVRVVVFRDGGTKTVRVRLGRLESQEAVVAAADPANAALPDGTAIASAGLTVAPMTPAVRNTFSLAEDVDGIAILAVESDGAAAGKGLRAGDVILEVGQEPVSTPAELVSAIETAKAAQRGSVLLLVQSGADLRFVPLPVDE
ncbi:MAG: DegQ family serine endoprotease [Pikeienuella sp.]